MVFKASPAEVVVSTGLKQIGDRAAEFRFIFQLQKIVINQHLEKQANFKLGQEHEPRLIAAIHLN